MSTWISDLKFGRRTVCVIQCDLEKHSDWFYSCVRNGWGERAALAKMALANQIQTAISEFQFEKIFWAGDGGAYASPEIAGRRVIEAARQVLVAFRDWQDKSAPELLLKKLGLRVSCHQCTVFCGP